MELINAAAGAAEAVVAAGRARAQSIELVAKSLCDTNGQNAASLAIAEKYVSAFQVPVVSPALHKASGQCCYFKNVFGEII
jgi:hypothetical protein